MSKIKSAKPFRLILLTAILTALPLLIAAQDFGRGETFWNWKTAPDKVNFQLNFQLSLRIKGRNVRGALVFSNLTNGEWDDSDRDITPFTGKLINGVILIEFDAEDIRNYEEYDSPFDIKYRKSKKYKANRAVIKIRKGKLEFRSLKGRSFFGLPRKILMRRMV